MVFMRDCRITVAGVELWALAITTTEVKTIEHKTFFIMNTFELLFGGLIPEGRIKEL